MIVAPAYNNRFPIFAIDRLRMGTDGRGITTLVCFMKCPLKCVYCLNDQCHETVRGWEHQTLQSHIMMLSPMELYDKIKIDNIYFQTTGGGICFGGGEPTLRSRFIEAFHHICHPRWNITIETSLSCNYSDIARLAPFVNQWIVDVKSMNPNIYERYTGRKSDIRRKLVTLMQLCGQDKIIVKVPLIPKFNTEEDVQQSISQLKEMGLTHIESVNFIEHISKYPPKIQIL